MMQLGQLVTGDAHMDAVHVPVMPCEASATLFPGDHIRIENGRSVLDPSGYAIVDPFLPHGEPITRGQVFVAMIVPGTVHNLRHEWTLPGLDAATMNRIARDPEGEKIRQLEAEVERLKAIEERFEGYDDDDGCRGCY